MIAGAPGVDKVLAVFGGQEDTSEVFGAQPAAGNAESSYAASSGGADDILGREKTLFPDTVDETVYPMDFEHVLPTEGTLTSDFGSPPSARRPDSPASTTGWTLRRTRAL